jgi:mannosyltransferase
LVDSKRSAGFLCDPPDLVNPHGVQVNDYLPTKDKQQAWTDLDFGGKYGVGILGHVRKQKGGHLFVKVCLQLSDKYIITIVLWLARYHQATKNLLSC